MNQMSPAGSVRTLNASDNIVLGSNENRFIASLYPQLHKDVPDVEFDSRHTDRQMVGDLTVAHTAGNEFENLQFARAELEVIL